jgi:hypothetical protein
MLFSGNVILIAIFQLLNFRRSITSRELGKKALFVTNVALRVPLRHSKLRFVNFLKKILQQLFEGSAWIRWFIAMDK